MHVNIPKAEPSVDFKLRECVMKKSTTVLASVALGAMLATGSATASMARDSVQKRHIHRAGNHGLVYTKVDPGSRPQPRRRANGLLGNFSDSSYHYQPWWNYETDAAYCSYSAVITSYETFEVPGRRIFCP
jgi:hypothetical protein